eukprot:6057913-Heterocapsa_arctica.AAC.1
MVLQLLLYEEACSVPYGAAFDGKRLLSGRTPAHRPKGLVHGALDPLLPEELEVDWLQASQ